MGPRTVVQFLGAGLLVLSIFYPPAKEAPRSLDVDPRAREEYYDAQDRSKWPLRVFAVAIVLVGLRVPTRWGGDGDSDSG